MIGDGHRVRCMLSYWLISVFVFALSLTSLTAVERPNIVWLSAEDIGPHLGCFGDPHAITPHLDRLATEGVRYTRTFTTAGVCAPCRSGIITGMYQTTLGTQHMRCRAKLPSFIKPFTVYLREAGYYCSNNSKTDYQFEPPANTWDESSDRAHWRRRSDRLQPFFSVFNFGGCHESGIANEGKYLSVTQGLKASQRQDPQALSTFPPYYPESPIAREDWKRNYELITAMDVWVGDIIRQLKEDGLYEDTIIFFWSDHGVGLPRAKRWLYDSGTHIPLIVRVPERWRLPGQGRPGAATDRLVSSIDFGPTVLNLAGLKVPEHVQGIPFLGGSLPTPRAFVYGARDRMDERYDIIRMVRDKRFKYIRNYEPLKTFYQYMNTPEKGATMTELRRRHEAGTLRVTADYFFSSTKPTEELYDTQADPHELKNLANDSRYAVQLMTMREVHLTWVKETRDLGLIAEPLLVEREKAIGHRYGILRQGDEGALSQRVARVAALASGGVSGLHQLIEALEDTDAAVRYWGAVGVANLGLSAASAESVVRKTLKDLAPVVRVAAAHALCRLDQPRDALPVLTRVLKEGEQWERLHAAIVLDEIDEQARPVIEAMRAALTPRRDLYAGGKYTVRVINRALNQLEGTNRTVR
ncbi:MAG: hypothetical protein M2R45_03030 [Verrucomicrobia subdivision 3 bacterium]|nr:hypothetical protein [Limisphaerales bacterium]MCS1415550.1 hypothetical protein [Limisphaerales bacterium]